MKRQINVAAIRRTTSPSAMFVMAVVFCSLHVLNAVDAADTADADPADVRPNVLWISCEDISPHLGCYGVSNAVTPHLDAFARTATRYTNVFTTAGVCAPCRSGIITGIYQNSLGSHHMRCQTNLPAGMHPFPVFLRQAGYYCSNNSKQDYQFATPPDVWDDSSGKAHWRNRAAGQPFFAVFNFTGCHESGIKDAEKYANVTRDLPAEARQDPEKLELPPYYPQTPAAKEDWKRYFELISAMDAWAGKILQELRDDDLSENTIVMFWSDHGVGLPRAKRWLYDSGTHIPLLIHIPASLQQELLQ
ncbi:MAG: sulfatase-like hydrolase/transferase, partial [Planctomycetales bacterium]|nr:sulfatase-like hydrolase/transferase [Planctomycetales bacterium]